MLAGAEREQEVELAADLREGDQRRVGGEHAAVDQAGAVEADRLEVGRRGGGRVGGVDHRGAGVLALRAQQVDRARLGVVGGQQQRQRGGGHRRVAEVALERLHESLVRVALVEVAAERGDLLEQRAVEDLRALLDVERRRSRPPAAGRACRARRRGSRPSRCRRSCRRGRRSGAPCALDLGQHERGDQPADAAAVDGENLHGAASYGREPLRALSAAGTAGPCAQRF